MARKWKASKRPWVVGIILGVGAAVAGPYAAGYIVGLVEEPLRNWIGQIVVEAVHLHWNWEQRQPMIPANLIPIQPGDQQ